MTFQILGRDHWSKLAAEYLDDAFPGIDPWTPAAPGETVANDAAVLREVLGEMCAAEEARLPVILDQAFSDTASADYLERIAAKYGLARLPATAAAGTISVLHSADQAVAAGTQFFGPAGQRYTATLAVSLLANQARAIEVAATETGPAGNLDTGAPLTSTVAGTIESLGITGGADEETTEELRARVRRRETNPGGYGRATDYLDWALEVPGVHRAWVRDALVLGPGNVGVIVAVAADTGSIVPDAALIDDVRTHLRARMPAEVGLRVSGPVPRAVDVTVPNLLPQRPEVQNAVLESLREAFLDLAEPAPLGGGVFYRSWLVQAVANAAGEVSHSGLLPAADVVLAADEVAVLGSVSFT